MNLYVSSDWEKIGISASGGADSTILIFLLCLQTNAEIHLSHQIRAWRKRPWQKYIFHDVVEWLSNRFDNKFVIHENFIPPEMEEPDTTFMYDEYGKWKPGNRIILRSYNEYIAHRENLDALYAAVNMNPDIEFEGRVVERDQGHLPQHFIHDGIHIIHPFIHTRKDWIIRQYYENNIVDLLDLTRSCNGEITGLNYKTYIPGQTVPVCKECFWCKEREWAIEQATR